MIGHTEKVWLLLVGLTFAGAMLGETGEAGWALAFTVSLLIAFKGGIVVDHYMEMRSANQRFRNVLRLFITLIPILVLFSHGLGERIRQLTTIH